MCDWLDDLPIRIFSQGSDSLGVYQNLTVKRNPAGNSTRRLNLQSVKTPSGRKNRRPSQDETRYEAAGMKLAKPDDRIEQVAAAVADEALGYVKARRSQARAGTSRVGKLVAAEASRNSKKQQAAAKRRQIVPHQPVVGSKNQQFSKSGFDLVRDRERRRLESSLPNHIYQ